MYLIGKTGAEVLTPGFRIAPKRSKPFSHESNKLRPAKAGSSMVAFVGDVKTKGLALGRMFALHAFQEVSPDGALKDKLPRTATHQQFALSLASPIHQTKDTDPAAV
jgi:hypothetical protein